MQRELLKQQTHDLIFERYERFGLYDATKTAQEVLSRCESTDNFSASDRGIVKGELAESILEVNLREYQKIVKPSVLIKGLCIKALTGEHRTTEMDLTMFTPNKIYMFECKSYGGKKTLSGICTLKSQSLTKDIYAQMKLHMDILNQYVSQFRIYANRGGNGSAFKLILFELSSENICDTREEKCKRIIPVATLGNISQVMASEFLRKQKPNWDLPRMVPVLRKLAEESPKNFEIHMKRMRELNHET